jgi:hypothetical protein
MAYRSSVIRLGFLCAALLACGRTDLDGPFAAAGTIPITTGAAGDSQSTGVAGASPATGSGGSEQPPNGSGGAGEAGSRTGEAGSGDGGHAGNMGQGGSFGSGSAGSAGGGEGGAGGSGSISAPCDPVAQNCGPGLRCDFPNSGPLALQCITDAGGKGPEGQICQDSSQDCAKGSTCVQPVGGRSERPSGSATCFVFCFSSADCPGGIGCTHVVLFNDGGSRVRMGICQTAPPNNN